MMKKLIFLLIFSNSLVFFGQDAVNEFKIQNNKSIAEFKKTPALKNAHYGISIRNLSNGKELININANHSFAPASNLKLLYTLTAIHKLGKDYRYKTKLVYSGKLVNKMLFGDLIIVPSGDPTFGSPRMGEDYQALIDQMISVLHNKNIKTITGNLVMACNGWRYPAPGSWPIEDIGNYYGTGAWNFNFNDNRIDLYLKRSTHTGEPTSVLYTQPKINGIKYISKVTTAAPDTSDEAYIYAAPFDTQRYILGTIPAGKKPFRVKGGIPNPPLSFLKIFKEKLQANGIKVKHIQVRYAQKNYPQVLWTHKSKPLIDIVKVTNDYSMNHFSEALAWSLIQGDAPANGYLNKEKIHDFFVPYGFDDADIEDGCGLAPDDLVQPTQMTAFLKLMSDKLGQAVVLDILPQGDKDGYAKYFLKGDALQNQIWVKSGSVSKVQNYTGIFKAKSGKYYAFSVMTNYFIGKHKDVRKAIEKLVKSYMNNL
jgi:D-alanyl-D-alanine carboxypeptidase/D-alanyl-D-alanine-endopeptidase (penicillin-binding protein 4)